MVYYSYANLNSQTSNTEKIYNGNRKSMAFRIIAAGDLIDLKPTKLSCYVNKIGSPTGTLQCAIFDVTTGLTEVEVSSTTFDISALSTGQHEFTFTGGTTLAAGHMMGLLIDTGTGSASNALSFAGAAPEDTTAKLSYKSMSNYDGTWNDDNYNLNWILTASGGPSSGGTRLPPPPIVLGGL